MVSLGIFSALVKIMISRVILIAPRAVPFDLTPGVSDTDQSHFSASVVHLQKNDHTEGD